LKPGGVTRHKVVLELMREVIAEQLEPGTGAVVGARTVRGSVAQCRLSGNELPVGVVDLKTPDGTVIIRVSTDPRDYQQARIYEENVLLESLLVREGTVVYVDEAAEATARAVARR
jgi:hypothetical protein